MEIEKLVGQFVMLGVVAMLFAGMKHAMMRREQEIERQWRAFAQERGWTFSPATGSWFARTSPSVQGSVGEVAVVLDRFVVQNGRTSAAFTRLTAKAPQPVPVSVRVYRESLLRTLGSMAGMQDIAVGDVLFDERCVVKADDERLARALLGAPLRESLQRWMLTEPEEPGFTYDRGEIRLIWSKVETRRDVLLAAVDVAVAAARSDARGA